MRFADVLEISRGVTAIIGSGGKTSLLYRLTEELEGTVIVCTSTQIFPPSHLPVFEEITKCDGKSCLGTPCANGKLSAPKQSFPELAALADYVLVEADGSKHLPLKAHAPHEPVIPENAAQVITVVGASGLNLPIQAAVHRHEIFHQLTGADIASPEAVALALEKEALGNRIFINQADTNEAAAHALAQLLSVPVHVASLQKGDILCSY